MNMKIKTKVLGIFFLVLIAYTSCGKQNISQENKMEPEPVLVEKSADDQIVTPESEGKIADNEAQKDEIQPFSDSRDLQVEEYLSKMTLEEKVAQLFVVLPESLVDMNTVTAAGDITKRAFDEVPVGGFIYMEKNLCSFEQVKTMLENVQAYSMERLGLPAFICVDEEGGTVTRIGDRSAFDVPDIKNMSEIGKGQNVDEAYHAGEVIGGYLSELGFNVDFAPVADVWSNPNNKVVRYRSFGENPQLVSDMSLAFLNGLQSKGVLGAYKHFPGHGATEGDTHAGYAYTSKSLEQLLECELVPFQTGINQGVQFIMVGHIAVPDLTGDDTPSSVSAILIEQVLREQMGYDGIVITDAMNMGAIVQNYSSAQAAVNALQAGVDIILMPKDFNSAYNGVLEAVEQQILSVERIDESLRRIIKIKLSCCVE